MLPQYWTPDDIQVFVIIMVVLIGGFVLYLFGRVAYDYLRRNVHEEGFGEPDHEPEEEKK